MAPKYFSDDLRITQGKWLHAFAAFDERKYLTVSSVYGTLLTKATDYMPVLKIRRWAES